MSLRETNSIVNQKFGIIVDTTPNFFVCSMFKENWSICEKHKLWGVPENSTAATSAIKRVKPGDYLIFGHHTYQLRLVFHCLVSTLNQ